MVNPAPRSLQTRTHFEQQVNQVHDDVLRMGALVEQSCHLARQALAELDLEAPNLIDENDHLIDRYYRQIEQGCLRLVALQSPVGRDLRILSTLMQVVRDLERIGDYAKDVGELTVRLFPYLPHPAREPVTLMLERCRSLLALSLQALADYDADLGRSIKRRDDAVDQDYAQLYERLVYDSDYQRGIESTVLFALIIRYLERMADHATNVGQRVAFIETGQFPNS
jgi:phosphate transport system protein